MKKSAAALLAVVSVAAGAVAGYFFMTKTETGELLRQRISEMSASSKQKMEEMSEEVAVRTAKVTNNPKITQDWVAHQWDNIGY